MIIIEDILVSDLLFERKFVCNLQKCKGACCWEGDFGAPVEQSELDGIRANLDRIKELVDIDAQKQIESKGPTTIYQDGKDSFLGTTLMPDGACVFMYKDEQEIAQCAIETAHKTQNATVQKPISCKLYPVRVLSDEHFVALNYDEWDICAAACKLGDSLSMPVFRFVKSGLERKFGFEFVQALEDYYASKYDDA